MICASKSFSKISASKQIGCRGRYAIGADMGSRSGVQVEREIRVMSNRWSIT